MRIRKKIHGTAERPRLSVFRSNKQISVQVIDDDKGITLAAATSRTKEIAEQAKITKTEQARLVGKLAAQKALEKGITQVVFDRSGYLYHGRVKALADAAREGGLKF
jgi:large subunit ribosomal protein L18